VPDELLDEIDALVPLEDRHADRMVGSPSRVNPWCAGFPR
jgi:hypothetical protein